MLKVGVHRTCAVAIFRGWIKPVSITIFVNMTINVYFIMCVSMCLSLSQKLEIGFYNNKIYIHT